jgi:ketosteroid isomerase-like protein
MSQENVELVRRMWVRSRSTDQADLPAFLVEFFDSEIEWHDAPSLPGAAVYRGHEALRRHIEDYLDAWAESGFEIEEIRSVRDRVLTRGRYVGVGQQSGMRLEDNVVLGVYDLRSGRILRVRQFVDEAEALKAVGLRE